MDREIDAAALEAAMAAYHNHWERASGAPETIARECMTVAITAYLAARPTPDAEAMDREFVEVLNRHDGNVTTLTVTRIVSKSDEKAERLAAGSKQELIDLYRKAVSR